MKRESPTKPPAATSVAGQTDAAHEGWTSLGELWRAYGQRVAIAVLIGAIAYLVYVGALTLRRQRAAAASAALAAAKTPEQLQEVISRYGRTPSGPPAMLTLASLRYQAGAYDVALSLYDSFLKSYPAHPMAPAAEVGRLHALEGLGRTAEALEGYARFIANHGDHYLLPLAVFGHARCLSQLNRRAEARTTLEDFLVSGAEEPWKSEAEMMIARLQRQADPGEPVSSP